jgi:hypothetical protein
VPALEPIAGAWTKSDEAGEPVLTIDGTAAPAVPAGTFPLAALRDPSDVRRGRLSVQFKLVGGASDQTAGIVFNLRPDGRYHFARYNTKDGNVAIWKFENGARQVLAHGEAHQQLARDAWHYLSVTIEGAVVSVTAAGGALTASHTLDAPVEGRVGLWTKPDSITAFRRFAID